MVKMRVPQAGKEIKVPDYVKFVGMDGKIKYAKTVTKTGNVASRMGEKVLDLVPKVTGYVPPVKKARAKKNK